MSDEELKAIMHNYRLTADDVTKICHVNTDTVYSWRIGRRSVSRPAAALLRAWMEGKNEKASV